VLVAGAPNEANAKRFIDFLLGPQTEKLLAESEAAQMPLRDGVAAPEHVTPLKNITPMEVDYEALAPLLEELSRGYLKQWVDRNLR
jgi:iron(III) transport system substrate-binding protein